MYERYRQPVARVMAISHVRLLEKWPSCRPGSTSAASRRVAEAVNSGNTNPWSPANPQQPACSGTTTSWLQAWAIASNVGARFNLTTEQTGCNATDPSFCVTV